MSVVLSATPDADWNVTTLPLLARGCLFDGQSKLRPAYIAANVYIRRYRGHSTISHQWMRPMAVTALHVGLQRPEVNELNWYAICNNHKVLIDESITSVVSTTKRCPVQLICVQ